MLTDEELGVIDQVGRGRLSYGEGLTDDDERPRAGRAGRILCRREADRSVTCAGAACGDRNPRDVTQCCPGTLWSGCSAHAPGTACGAERLTQRRNYENASR